MHLEQVLRPDLQILLMSGYSEEETLSRFQSGRLAGFLHKPFKMSALIDQVHKILVPDERVGHLLTGHGAEAE